MTHNIPRKTDMADLKICMNCLAWTRCSDLSVNGVKYGECRLNPQVFEKHEKDWCLQFNSGYSNQERKAT